MAQEHLTSSRSTPSRVRRSADPDYSKHKYEQAQKAKQARRKHDEAVSFFA